MICNNCAAPTSDTWAYCPYCGSKNPPLYGASMMPSARSQLSINEALRNRLDGGLTEPGNNRGTTPGNCRPVSSWQRHQKPAPGC